jgi:GH24 family phage-related lysozyme (muramidase)
VISPPSEEEIEGEVDQATEDSQQIYSEYEPEKDTRLVDIITDTYPNLPTETVVFVAHVLAEQNNIKDFSVDNIVIKKGQKIKVFNNDKIKEIISSLGNKMQKMPKERWTQPDQIPFEYENVRFAPQDLSFISGVEGNELVAYDDKMEGSEWKPGKVPVGRWTIGQGHLLTKDELRTGQINIDGELVDWRNGITPEQSDKLHQQDLGVNVETAKKFMEGRKLTLAQKMVLHDIGFLYGTDDAKLILEQSLIGDTIDKDKFREALVNFRVANDAGAAARRIADFLILNGIRLPIPPDNSLNKKYNYYNKYYAGKIPDKEIQFGVPNKNLVDLLTQTYAGFDSNSNSQKTKDFLELVKTNDPKTAQDLLRLLDSLK